jgi:hypothetical protein
MITTYSPTEDYIYHSTLRQVYALPPNWIRQLGQPDKVESHPRDSTRKITLYTRQRVEDFIEERRAAYLRMLVARAKRFRLATAETCRQAQQLLAWARTVDITVGPLPDPPARLKQETKASFLRAGIPGQDFILTGKAIVAHVRHTNTNYHRLLARLNRAPGTTVAYLILKQRVNRAIRDRLRQQYGDFSPEEPR